MSTQPSVQDKQDNSVKKQKFNIKRESMAFSRMIGSSSRLTLTYIVLTIWVALAIFAILVGADLYALATYFASGLPLILGYLWSETSRPTIKDAAEIVRGIGMRPGNNNMGGYGGYNSYGGNYGGYGSSYGGYGGGYGGGTYDQYSQTSQYNQSNQSNQILTNNQIAQNSIISIYSDDASIELKINQNQLSTLMNIGYVDMISDKYTFKRSLLDQVKSLINDKSIDPIL